MAGWLEVGLMSLAALLILIGISRLYVRKPLGETSHLEFGMLSSAVIILAIGSFQLSIPVPYLLTALLVWAGGTLVISFLSMKSHVVRAAIFGKGTPVMKDGKILEDNLKKHQVTTDELLRKLRKNQVFQFSDVEFAVLESNGELNVLLKKEQQPITPRILAKQVAPVKEPQTVIMDGKILDEPLATRGFNRVWLEEELAKKNAIIDNVFLAQIDEHGQLTVDLFDDLIQVPEPVELPLLAASIKKVQADLELYALDTENKQAVAAYAWSAKQMQEVYDQLEIYLN